MVYLQITSKILLIFVSGEKAVVKTAFMFAKNTINYGRLDDFKTTVFGPSELLVADDPEVASEVRELRSMTAGITSKFITVKEGTSEG